MPDEQAFLDALKSNPADDTTRLVYADWLDEQGETAKAEYLRLVVGLVPHYVNAAPDPPETARVQALAEQLPREWRTAAAARFATVFYGCDPAHKIHAIKLVRELTGYSLADSKQFVESQPARLPMRVTLEIAIGLRDHLRDGRSIRVEVHPDGLDELPRLCFYSVSAYIDLWDGDENPEPAVMPEEAVGAFAVFLTAAMNISPNRAAELAREHYAVVADGIEPSQVSSRMAELQALLPPPDTAREWHIALYTTHQVIPPLTTR